MKILDGKKIATKILDDLKNIIDQEKLHLGLGVVLVGSDEASKIYVGLKEKRAGEVGITFRKIEMSESATEKEVLQEIENLNQDEKIQGIIVQLPLPNHLDRNMIIQAIDARKDVDGFHSENIEAFHAGREIFVPVFPKAIMELLKSAEEKLENKHAVIVCNSKEFGHTMQIALEKENISAEYIFHQDVLDELKKIKHAEILVTACGEAGLIKGEMLSEDVIIVDGGIAKVDGKIFGDVDFESVENMEGYISPVPGGVGPVTIACLLRNVYEAKKSQ